MGTKTVIFITFCLALTQVRVCGGQPNDNFADRIVLSGDDVVFTGDLTGSTIEPNEPLGAPYWPGFPATHSVWWSWTATETKPVTIVALNYSEDTYIQGSGELTSMLAVYAGTNVFGPPAPAATTNAFWLNAAFNKLAMSFPGVAGTTYQIHLFGSHPTQAVTFRLLATNPPVVLEPPTSQTTFPGGSALFAVIATGLSSMSYQWCLEGTALPGRTSPMLALNNVTADQAGAYSVVASNCTGAITTGPVYLRLASSAANPVLGVTAGTCSNLFAFTLAAEEGRYYRIQSSSNLASWHNEASFSSIPLVLRYPQAGAPKLSVVYNANSNSFLSIPMTTNGRFVRASLYAAPNEICINNLKQIRFAKDLWARSQPLPLRQRWPAISDLLPQISALFCPLAAGGPVGASYIVNDVLTAPICTFSLGHVLEEP